MGRQRMIRCLVESILFPADRGSLAINRLASTLWPFVAFGRPNELNILWSFVEPIYLILPPAFFGR
jgi:hypothetical protein